MRSLQATGLLHQYPAQLPSPDEPEIAAVRTPSDIQHRLQAALDTNARTLHPVSQPA